MPLLPDNENFDRRWLHESTAEVNVSTIRDLVAVREFAYHSFDRLDKDGNGFIETHELTEALEKGDLSNREKSFVHFLLNNQEQIAEMQSEEVSSTGISRKDIDSYFKLLANLL